MKQLSTLTQRLYSISNLNKIQSKKELSKILSNRLNADILIIKNIGFSRYNIDNINEYLKEAKHHYPHVLVVPGNEDYHNIINYRRDYIKQKMNEVCQQNDVFFLEKNDIYINNIHFIGTTLWSLISQEWHTNDFSRRVFRDKYEYRHEFFESYYWLKDILDRYQSYDEKQVIITYHLPSLSFLDNTLFDKRSAYGTEIINSYLNLKNVKYWFTGKGHSYREFKYKKTNYILNPCEEIKDKVFTI
jgi:Icc-related predicted phosphoesterase